MSEEDTDCWSLPSEEEMLLLAVDGGRQEKKIEAEMMIEGNKVRLQIDSGGTVNKLPSKYIKYTGE